MVMWIPPFLPLERVLEIRPSPAGIFWQVQVLPVALPPVAGLGRLYPLVPGAEATGGEQARQPNSPEQALGGRQVRQAQGLG